MSIMTPAAIGRLGQLFDDEWRTRLAAWEGAGPVRSTTSWAGC
ncbi:hypothetical protein NKG94_44590 [Micromonospora sp. M12]